MITYVESNFILEIALNQEQSLGAERILEFAEQELIQLSIPAFGLSEPFSRVRQRGRDRRHAVQSLDNQIRDLARSRNYAQLADTLQQVARSVVDIEFEEMARLVSVAGRVLAVANVIPITANDYAASLNFQDQFGLSPEDALVLSGVLQDLQLQSPDPPKCFVSRDAKAFFDPGIESLLDGMNCRYLARFPNAVDYIIRFAS